MFWKLRIAFSLACVVACSLILIVWARSYRVADRLHFSCFGRDAVIASKEGRVTAFRLDWPVHVFDRQWITYSVDDELAFPIGFQTTLGFGWINDPILPLERSKVAPPPGSRFRFYGTGTTTLPASGPVLPYWLFAVVFGLAAAALGIRRPFRYGLRTLIIAMTVIAVYLSFVMYELEN